MAGGTPTLYLLSGLPCSGKSTYARQLESHGVMRVNVDEMMIAAHGRLDGDYDGGSHLQRLDPVLNDAREIVAEHLANGSDVVLDHGLGLRAERDAWKQIAAIAGAQWELLCFDADIATLRARCALRSQSPDAVPITDDLLQTLAGMWQPPVGEGEHRIDSTADWAQDFYSITDLWWGHAGANIDTVDRARARWIAELVGATQSRSVSELGCSVLELGCGAGATAAATADLGFNVTGIDFSDRINRAPASTATLIKANFYDHDFGDRFDVVTYWDGFGVSSDNEHLALLDRIAGDLVQPDGLVVIEVFDPLGWENDDGLIEHKPADPQRGYTYTLTHSRTFDAASRRAVDAWKEAGNDRIWSQTLRCYSRREFADLVTASALELIQVLDVGRSDWSYIAVLRPQGHGQ